MKTAVLNASLLLVGGVLAKPSESYDGGYSVTKPGYPSEGGYDGGYDDGYDGGHDDGYDGGHDDGYDGGHDDGYDGGHDDGYDGGHDDGYDGGHDDGYDGGHDDGYDGGHDDGYDGGHDDGYGGGHDDGYDGGHDGGYDPEYPSGGDYPEYPSGGDYPEYPSGGDHGEYPPHTPTYPDDATYPDGGYDKVHDGGYGGHKDGDTIVIPIGVTTIIGDCVLPSQVYGEEIEYDYPSHDDAYNKDESYGDDTDAYNKDESYQEETDAYTKDDSSEQPDAYEETKKDDSGAYPDKKPGYTFGGVSDLPAVEQESTQETEEKTEDDGSTAFNQLENNAGKIATSFLSLAAAVVLIA